MVSLYLYKIRIEGFVQGIGFRPFVFKLATEMALKGWVNNDTEGVNIQIEASEAGYQLFVDRLKSEKPKLAVITKWEVQKTALVKTSFIDFQIRPSSLTSAYGAAVLPDLSLCQECLSDITDPQNRRYQYLFTNCTYCGPRFSIIQGLPYDRALTTMATFKQCEDCQREYEDPRDRRFHAQPNACPRCGPQVVLKSPQGQPITEGFIGLEHAVAALKSGSILALKGLGGYQLVVDARNESAVQRLRQRKGRSHKPFAVMMGTIDEVKTFCEVSEREAQELLSVAAPIVILRAKTAVQRKTPTNTITTITPTTAPTTITMTPGDELAAAVAPNNPYLGAMLPNTPLHYWLLRLFGGPLVMTSANLSEEPLVYQDQEALARLSGLADIFLMHNRPIARPIDDSVVQVVEEQVFVLRAARGLAPLNLPSPYDDAVLAVGPHMKNTFALGLQKKWILSQHLGDMESERSQDLFRSEIANYQKFYHWQPKDIVCDAHPGYFTTEWAQDQQGDRLEFCQHHRAHIYATLAEHKVEGSYLGVAWDGTGYGDDKTIWGGEFFLGDGPQGSLKRVGHLRPFLLLGGEAAVRSPWRVALSLLFDIDRTLAKKWFAHFQADKGTEAFSVLAELWERRLNAPSCTSMGRFMEGIASLLGITHENAFEADAAMQLEFCADQKAMAFEAMAEATPETSSATRFATKPEGVPEGVSRDPELVSHVAMNKNCLWSLAPGGLSEWDWRPWVAEATESILRGCAPSFWAAKLHHALIDSLYEMARQQKQTQIVIGGGCFQNRLLVGQLLQRAASAQTKIIAPRRVPLNDGGVALGQLYSFWAGLPTSNPSSSGQAE